MGTDVYLEWEGKNEEDENKQAEGCLAIDAGDVGYLRASIHMENENALLRMMFPAKYWNEHSRDEYDFRANSEMLEMLGLRYLVSAVLGKAVEVPEEQNEAWIAGRKMAERLSQMLKGVEEASGGDVSVFMGETDGLRDAVEWLNSVFEFFELGIEQQEKGLKPYPYISW